MYLTDVMAFEEEEINYREINEAIKSAIGKMNEREVKVLTMYLSEMTQTEIGKAVGLSQVHVSRILKKLFLLIKTEYWEGAI